jgi:hypothetical protein
LSLNPISESAQALARHWLDLIQGFTEGDVGIETVVADDVPEAASQGAVVEPEATEMWEFTGRAIAHKI